MEVIPTGKDTWKRRIVEFEVLWLIRELKLSKSQMAVEIIPRKGLRLTHSANGLSGRVGDTMALAVDIDLPVPQLLATVAHEMIHVKQQAKGQLRYDMHRGKEIAFWCGKLMSSKMNYFERPWEIEAFGKQEILARRFDVLLDRILHDRKR